MLKNWCFQVVVLEKTPESPFSSVQLLSHVRLFATLWTAASDFLFITNSQSLVKLMPIEWVMPSPISSSVIFLLPSVFPSIKVFYYESVLHIRWPKNWSFSFSISLSNEYSGSISFWVDWFDILAVQGTLKSLLQHHNPLDYKIHHYKWQIL